MDEGMKDGWESREKARIPESSYHSNLICNSWLLNGQAYTCEIHSNTFMPKAWWLLEVELL